MAPEEFIDNLVLELEARLALYRPGPEAQSEVAQRIGALGLNAAQRAEVEDILRLVMNETTYGILCGIEGTGSIGRSQVQFRLQTEAGAELTGNLDSLFYERSHSQ